MTIVLLVIHIIVAIALVGVILLQRSEGGGLGMGSSGGANAFMSVRGQANFMTRLTAILAGIFMVTSIVLAILAGNHGQSSSIVDQLPAPATSAPAPLALPASPEVPLAK